MATQPAELESQVAAEITQEMENTTLREISRTRVLYKDYLISDDGRVFSSLRAGNKPYRELKRRVSSAGYEQVFVYGRLRLVHVLVLEAFIGPRPSPDHVSMHLDGNTRNNHVSNLAWGTQSENLSSIGKKLTWKKVNEIRELLKEGNLSQSEIAKQFKVSTSTIYEIKKEQIWCK